MRGARSFSATPALQGAVVLAACGLVAATEASSMPVALVVAAITAAAIVATTFAPWQQRPDTSAVLFVALAVSLIGLAELHGLIPIRAYGNLFVLVFAWIGTTQRPLLSVYVAPIVCLAYVLPLPLSKDSPPLDPRAVIVMLAVGIGIAETMARTLHAVQRLQRRAERAADLFRTVFGAGANLRALDPEDVLDTISDTVIEIGYEGANIAIVDREAQTFRPRHTRGAVRELEGKSFPIDSGTTGRVIATRMPVVTDDYSTAKETIAEIARTGVRTSIAVPVFHHGDVVAVLQASSLERIEVNQEDVDALALLATTAGNALDIGYRYEEERAAALQHATEAATDALTGLGNRRHAERLLDRLQPEDVVVILDLDHFKNVNDRYGHPAGDALLKDLAAHFRDHLRDTDTISRYGGEEFLVVLSSTSLQVAVSVIERLQRSWRDAGPLTTFSAGVARHGGRGRLATLGAADRALYEAKRRGRDRVCVEAAPQGVRPADSDGEADNPGQPTVAKRG